MDRLNISRREGVEPPPELSAIRRMIGDPAQRYPRHPGVRLDYRQIGGVRCLVLTPREVGARVLYFHGGGFRLGSPEIAAGFASRLAHAAGCEVMIPVYGLAPEHPFPGALLEGQDVLEALAGEKTLFIGGDSAGGNFAAVLGRRFAGQIAGVVLLSPWLDLRVEAGSYTTNARVDTVFSQKSAREAASLYLQGWDPADPDVSPLLGDLSAMPPVFITAGAEEVLLDDAKTFAHRLTVAKREVSLHVFPRMFHVEPTLKPDSESTSRVLNLSTAFVKKHIPNN